LRLSHPQSPADTLVATEESLTLGSVEDDMAREPEAVAELRRSLGSQLATFRLAADLTQGQLAKVAYCDRTTIVHIEKGRARADERFWRAVDMACDADGALVATYLELEAAKAEYERREREQRLASVRAKAAALRGRSDRATGVQKPPSADMPPLESLRRALLGHERDRESSGEISSSHFRSGVVEAHRLYQRADYDGAARILPSLIGRLEGSAGSIPAHTKSAAYLAAAKLATKVGDGALAWVAADRSLRIAQETDRHGLIGIASYQVACALLGNGHLADAEETATQAADRLASHAESKAPDMISTRGALLLLLAIITGRQGDSQTARRKLRDAARLAEQLGQDGGNVLWTAFGPTNIAIHELAVHVALGDSRAAFQVGERIDTEALPSVLVGRRSQVHLELGWASVGQSDDGLAVLHLLEAERVAKQAVSRNATARALLTTLLARERQSATPGLRALAARAGAA
jgi:DNA-binding XRE family transcriptional regulator